MLSKSPIAVLDTGAGGLSIVRALRELLPREDIHYFADTAHFPYGIKSPELIRHLAIKMARRVFELSSCKMLVVACHTISTWSLGEIADILPIPVVGMVAPTVDGLTKLLKSRREISTMGIISTKATVMSGAYRHAWPAIDPCRRVKLVEQPAGSLVSLVEEPDVDFATIKAITEQFLPTSIKESDALLIGCTHFAALMPMLKDILRPGCLMIDGAIFAADACKEQVERASLLNRDTVRGSLVAYVSDNPQRFQIIARRFMEEAFPVEWLRDYARS